MDDMKNKTATQPTATATVKTTANELKMLNNIARSLYTPMNGGYPKTFEDAGSVWTFDVVEGWPNQRSVSGIISSLVKKELVGICKADKTSGDDHDAIWMTEAGFAIWQAAFPPEVAEAIVDASVSAIATDQIIAALEEKPTDGLESDRAAFAALSDEDKILSVMQRYPGAARRFIRDTSTVGEEPTYRILRKMVADGHAIQEPSNGRTPEGRPFRMLVYSLSVPAQKTLDNAAIQLPIVKEVK